MKKLLYFAFAAMVSFAATMTMTACGSDDDDEIVEDSSFKSAAVEMEYEFSADVFKLYDITINVTNFDGKAQSIDVTKAGKQTFTTTSKNGVVNVNYDCKAKEGVTIENSAYELKWKLTFASIVYFMDGDSESSTSSALSNEMRFAEGKLTAEGLASLNTRHAKSEVYTFTLKDGAFVK